VEETGGAEKTIDLKQVTDKLYHIMLYTSPWSGFELTTSVLICTDCICSCKSNYHTITPTAAQRKCECHTDHWLIFPSLGPAKRIGFECISFSYEICITQQFHVSKLKLCSSTMYVSHSSRYIKCRIIAAAWLDTGCFWNNTTNFSLHRRQFIWKNWAFVPGGFIKI
jgi:hypothetical protein